MKLRNLFEVSHTDTMQKKYEELSKLFTADYSEALKKFEDGVKICRMSNSTYDWRVIDKPRERTAVQGSKHLAILYNWFASENNLPLRSESIFGFTKTNAYADRGVFGDTRYYVFPKNETKIVCMKKDFNDDAGCLYSDISDCAEYYLDMAKKELGRKSHVAFNSPIAFVQEIVMPMADHLGYDFTKAKDLTKTIDVMRTVEFGDDEGPTPKDFEDAPYLGQLIKNKKLKDLIHDVEAAFENAIDVKTPKTIDNTYQEVFMSGECILVHSAVMAGYVRYLSGDSSKNSGSKSVYKYEPE